MKTHITNIRGIITQKGLGLKTDNLDEKTNEFFLKNENGSQEEFINYALQEIVGSGTDEEVSIENRLLFSEKFGLCDEEENQPISLFAISAVAIRFNSEKKALVGEIEPKKLANFSQRDERFDQLIEEFFSKEELEEYKVKKIFEPKEFGWMRNKMVQGLSIVVNLLKDSPYIEAFQKELEEELIKIYETKMFTSNV